MDMRGVLDQFGASEAVKRAIAAGIDVLIQPLDVPQTIDAVVAGVAEGRYTEARLDSSVRRVLETKRKLGLAQNKLVDLSALRFLVGDSSNLQIAGGLPRNQSRSSETPCDRFPWRRTVTRESSPSLSRVGRIFRPGMPSTRNCAQGCQNCTPNSSRPKTQLSTIRD